MARFCFYHGNDTQLAHRLQASCSALWGDVHTAQRNTFWLFIPASERDTTLSAAGAVVGAVSGYVRRDNLPHGQCDAGTLDSCHNRTFLETIAEDRNWPLGDEWTGSFGAVAYAQGVTVICNDLLGFQPVYYSVAKHGFIGGSSIIALGRSLASEADGVGVLQRITPPYCNYGRRTLLRGVSRLLPGERVRFSRDAGDPTSTFDNSLCAGVIAPDVDTAARLTWDCLQNEMHAAVGIHDRIAVAMSGGWDSRVVLAGVAHRAETVSCLTYGDPNAYEVLIAKRCAHAIGARHESFSIQGMYFPPREEFQRLVMETESFIIPEWYSMISAQRQRDERPMVILLGDHCQTIDARYMTAFASRSARRQAFMGGIVGKHEHLEATTYPLFDAWKAKTIATIVHDLCDHRHTLAGELAAQCTDEHIIAEATHDLELSMRRVRENIPPFTAMFDEVFNWFHKSRYTLSSQNLLLDAVYRSMSPSMSMRALRFLSTIHPRLRLRRRLMDALARLPEYGILGKIPSAQIPFLSARAPASMRELAWGLRSGLDQIMIGRVMRSKDPNKRQRVLHSLDYLREYRRPDVQSTVGSWFTPAWLRGEAYVRIARERGEMSSWPLINLDIAAPANVSMILDACQQDQ